MKTLIAIAAALVAMIPAAATSQALPSDAVIARIEASVRLPPSARPVADYDRTYQMSGAGRIVATYMLASMAGAPTAIHIHKLPSTEVIVVPEDGGCGVITFAYTIATGHFSEMRCNGLA